MFGRPSNPKPIKVRVFAKTDLGKTRDHNEDSFLVADLTRGDASLQPTVREHELGPRGTLLVVADGIVGAAAGRVTRDMATKTIQAALQEAARGQNEPPKHHLSAPPHQPLPLPTTPTHTSP